MKRSLLLTIVLLITLTAGKAQLTGTNPVFWPGFFPGIGDLRSATTIEGTADNGSESEDAGETVGGTADLYQAGEEIPAEESGFSFAPADVPDLRLFPNPASESFSVTEAENIDRIILYNMTGRQVRTFEGCNDNPHYIGDLPNGLYLVTLFNDQSGVVKTLRLMKRSVRP